jgi:hypothetical protein
VRAIAYCLLVILLSLSSGAFAACGPDPAPPPAHALGYDCETFYVNNPWSLTTDIDTNNTGAPGFKWYTNQNWVMSSFDGSRPHWGTLGITYPSDLSIVSGNLLLAPHTVTGGGPGFSSGFLMSCGPTTSPPYYQGQTFAGGMYYEAFSSWANGDAGTGEQARPSVWTTSVSFMVNSKSYPFDWYEMDSYDNPFGRAFHVWTSTGGSLVDSGASCTGCPGSQPSSGHSFGMLLVPSSLGGGTPRLDFYFDGVFQGTSPPPGGSVQSVFDLVANDPQCLIIGAANVNPATYDYVRVWQTPPGGGSGTSNRRRR